MTYNHQTPARRNNHLSRTSSSQDSLSAKVHLFPTTDRSSLTTSLMEELTTHSINYQVHPKNKELEVILVSQSRHSERLVVLIETKRVVSPDSKQMLREYHKVGSSLNNLRMALYPYSVDTVPTQHLSRVEDLLEFCSKNAVDIVKKIRLASIRSISRSPTRRGRP